MGCLGSILRGVVMGKAIQWGRRKLARRQAH